MLVKFVLRSWRTLQRAYALVRDARVPQHLKLGLIAAVLFILSPLNILGDIPLLGIADDAALLAGVASLFVNLAERALQRNVSPVPASPPAVVRSQY